MKTRHILLCLAMSLLGARLWAQDGLPQVFSPNAAELGKYGKIPVSYFNGLPNISIPLTELKAKGYTLPVYLTYHAGGNKPDQHPGWVGLGWTLHAGGCINRIINGKKDEMTWKEYSATFLGNIQNGGAIPFEPGYFARMSEVQNTDWAVGDKLDSIYTSSVYHDEDFYPDEFQICIDDIHASFFFIGQNQIRIVSDSDADFTVECRVNTDEDQETLYPDGSLVVYSRQSQVYRAHLYHYIEELIITNHDGTKYYFGGAPSTIEFSLTNPANVPWNPVATANTWMLRRIERPDGETITFSYSRSSVPVVKTDVHQVEYWHEHINSDTLDHAIVNSLEYPALRSNISFCLLMPVYLSSIVSSKTGNRLTFLSLTSNELNYEYGYPEFDARFIHCLEHDGEDHLDLSFDYIKSKDQYNKLNRIVSNRGAQIVFEYDNSEHDRLRLGGISILNGNTSEKKYSMSYDGHKLPAYNSKQTDAWGYYNGMIIGQTITDTCGINTRKQQVDTVLMKAEILTRLTYPTGGYTEFEYEVHHYGKAATQFPFNLISESGIAGGLRIKRMVDVAGGNREEHRFEYTQEGVSSGILSGFPLFRTSGMFILERETSYFWRPIFSTEYVPQEYDIYREAHLRQLSTTNGNHVTYSRIRDYNNDGAFTEYRYTNHDSPSCRDELPAMRYESLDNTCLEDGFISRQLFRGLLTDIIDYNDNGHIIKHETRYYETNTDDYIRAIDWRKECAGLLVRLSYLKIYSCFPKMIEKTVTSYPDSGTPHVDTTDYTYDSHRNLTEVSRTSGGRMDVNLFTYPGNYPDSPVYSAMSASGRHAFPVEHVHAVDGVVSEAELTTWKQDGAPGDFVPAEMYQATPTDVPDFNVLYDGTNVDEAYGPPRIRYLDYDAHSNLLRSATPDGVETTYTWDKDSTHIRGLFMGAGRKTRYRIWSELARVTEQENLSLIHDRFYVGSFTSVADGAVTVNIWFDAGDERDIWGKIDSLTFHCPSPSVVGGLSPVYTVTFQLEAGRHTLLLSTREGVFPPIVPILNAPDQGSGSGSHIAGGERPLDPLDPIIIIDPNGKLLRGHMSLTYWGDPDYVHERDEQECAHYSFEGTGDTPDGFESEKSQQSAVTVHLVLNPDLTYTLDRRVKRNGKWVYERMPFVVNTTDQYELYAGGAPFDEVRIYADRVQPETYTWWPDGNLRSRTDARGVTESYEYDGLGRLIRVYDNERKKVEEYMYNYQNK
jgi:RHS Repeat.